jgi:hypothetical protein
LVTRYDAPNGDKVNHWHTLENKSGSTTTTKVNGGQAVFPHLVIKRLKTTERQRPADQRVVRLHFELTYTAEDGTEQTAAATSQPVFNSELRIDRLSHATCPADAPTEMFVLCTKIQRKTIALQMNDVEPLPAGIDESVLAPGWFLDDKRRPSAFIANNVLITHHQLALVVPIPAYWTSRINRARTVELRLLDTTDGTDSPPVRFDYAPAASASTASAGMNGAATSSHQIQHPFGGTPRVVNVGPHGAAFSSAAAAAFKHGPRSSASVIDSTDMVALCSKYLKQSTKSGKGNTAATMTPPNSRPRTPETQLHHQRRHTTDELVVLNTLATDLPTLGAHAVKSGADATRRRTSQGSVLNVLQSLAGTNMEQINGAAGRVKTVEM